MDDHMTEVHDIVQLLIDHQSNARFHHLVDFDGSQQEYRHQFDDTQYAVASESHAFEASNIDLRRYFVRLNRILEDLQQYRASACPTNSDLRENADEQHGENHHSSDTQKIMFVILGQMDLYELGLQDDSSIRAIYLEICCRATVLAMSAGPPQPQDILILLEKIERMMSRSISIYEEDIVMAGYLLDHVNAFLEIHTCDQLAELILPIQAVAVLHSVLPVVTDNINRNRWKITEFHSPRQMAFLKLRFLCGLLLNYWVSSVRSEETPRSTREWLELEMGHLLYQENTESQNPCISPESLQGSGIDINNLGPGATAVVQRRVEEIFHLSQCYASGLVEYVLDVASGAVAYMKLKSPDQYDDEHNMEDEVRFFAAQHVSMASDAIMDLNVLGILSPTTQGAIRALWIACSNLAVASEWSSKAPPELYASFVSDLATIGQTVCAVRSSETNGSGQGLPAFDSDMKRALSITYLSALEFPKVLLDHEHLLGTIGQLSRGDTEVKHLVQGTVLRALVFPTGGATRDPASWDVVLHRLAEIGLHLSSRAADLENETNESPVADPWDQFFDDQISKFAYFRRAGVATDRLQDN